MQIKPLHRTMHTHDMLIVLENCRVSPPPATLGERSLPLTFFDTLWLLSFPIHQIFFYEFPHSREHFLETAVPKLKHSLSITLQHFFPFSGNLIVFRNPSVEKKPEIRYQEGDSVSVTFSECSLDFNHLTGNHPRNCNMFYPLVPLLGHAKKVSDYVTIPLFSIQVTLFPKAGISIGLTNQRSLCDAITRFNFLKAWTSIAKHGTDELFLASGNLPFYDRVIKYPSSLDEIYLRQPGIEVFDGEYEYQPHQLVSQVDKVRATIILTQGHIDRLKKWSLNNLPRLEYVTSFSVACGFVWSCIAKSRVHIGEKIREDDGLERFICDVDWRSRLNPPIPQTYFGNCVGSCFTTPTKSKLLVGEKGFVNAAKIFGKALSETMKKKDGVFKDAETWLKRAVQPVPSIRVSGTPKTKVYDVDFGWGKPIKHETISIDYNDSISVNSCRVSLWSDLEIGLSLPAKQMDAFISISRDLLEG